MTHRLVKLSLCILLLLAATMPGSWATPASAQTAAILQTRGLVTDVRGVPAAGVTVLASPDAVGGAELITDSEGRWTASHNAGGVQTFTVEGAAPVQSRLNQNHDVRIVLASGENQLGNGAFETDLSGWTAGGSATLAAEGHSGNAARLGPNCPLPCQTPRETFYLSYSSALDMLVDSGGNAHVMVDQGQQYLLRSPGGLWQKPEQPVKPGPSDYYYPLMAMQLDDEDTLHLLLSTRNGVYYAARPLNGTWTNMETLMYFDPTQHYYSYKAWIDIDRFGQVHAVFGQDYVGPVYYARRGVDGLWSAPVNVSINIEEMAAAADGTAYIFYDGMQQRVLTTGTPLQPVALGCYMTAAQSTSSGEVQGFCSDQSSIRYQVMGTNGEWQVRNVLSATNVSEITLTRDGGAAFQIPKGSWGIEWRVLLKQPDSDEFFDILYKPNSHSVQDSNFSLALESKSGMHFAYSSVSSAIYHQSRVDLQTTDAWLEQTLTVPEAGDAPTLSFLYQIQGPVALRESGFTVTLTGADGVPVEVYADKAVAPWKHAWVDLTPWAGQEVTLRFNYRQAAGEPLAALLLDEVWAGAYATPAIETLTPDWLPGGAVDPQTVTITGTSFQEGAVVEMAGQSLPATVINKTELTFQLPEGLGVGHYPLRVINPGGVGSNYAALRIGQQVMVPAVVK